MATTPTISAKIQLEGAEQIARQLDDLGKAGVKAFADIQRQAERAGGFDKLDPTEVQKRLEKFGLTGQDAFNKIQKAVEDTSRLEKFVGVVGKTESAFNALGKSALAVGRVFGPLGVAVVVLAEVFNKAAEAAQNLVQTLNNTAAAGNDSVSRLDGLRRMANQAGVSTEELTAIWQKLTAATDQLKADKLDELRKSADGLKAAGWGDQAINNWLKEQAANLDKLKTGGTTTAGAFVDLVKRLAQLQTQAERTGFAQRELGVTSQATVDALVRLGQRSDLSKQSLQALGQETVRQSNEQQQATARMKGAWDDLLLTIGKLGLGPGIDNFRAKVIEGIGGAIEWAIANWPKVGETIRNDASATWNWLKNGWQAVSEFLGNLWAGMVGVANNAWEMLKTGAQAVWDFFNAGWQAVADGATSAFDAVINSIQTVIDWAKQAWEYLQKIFMAQAPQGSTQVTGMASGGYVSGRGTGTSDSILARLSNGEFVMSAKAVKHFGSQFFSALNSLRTPRGFAAGGIVNNFHRHVSSVVPRFADGGLVSSAGRDLGTLTLQFGGQSVQVLATPNAAQQLTRFATVSGQRRAGRPPGWA